VAIINGSEVELLSQSQCSVRGHRVHKLRCDEVEEFKPEVWEAAQLVTRSGVCGGVQVRGAIEAMSTMHRPFGLMKRLVDRGSAGGASGVRLLRWCALDVVERCEPERDCKSCVLWEDCQGLAKEADGFIPVDDLVAQWHRTSRQTWASEMMCRQPRRDDSVYPRFDPQPGCAHVVAVGSDGDWAAGRAEGVAAMDRDGEVFLGGMDFGLRSPFVMLWARVYPSEGGAIHRPRAGADRVVEVVDEYVRGGLTLSEHIESIQERPWPAPQWVGVDPAGGARNSHSGVSDVQVLRRRGYVVKAARSSIREGIECIRRRLDHGTLRVHSSCSGLIEAMTTYHFDLTQPSCDQPVKDGPDHLCDALRYLVVNLDREAQPVVRRSYL
jgi:hypothetical protein